MANKLRIARGRQIVVTNTQGMVKLAMLVLALSLGTESVSATAPALPVPFEYSGSKAPTDSMGFAPASHPEPVLISTGEEMFTRVAEENRRWVF